MFEAEGCRVLETPDKGLKSTVYYTAQCGHNEYIYAACFRRGEGRVCKKCRVTGPSRTPEADVRALFEAEGCEVISAEWRIKKKPEWVVRYKARGSHEHTVTFRAFKDGGGRVCPECASRAGHVKKQIPDEQIIKAFEQKGLLVLEIIREHPVYCTAIRYRARCSHEHVVGWGNFSAGRGEVCPVCASRQMGESKQLSDGVIIEEFESRGCRVLGIERRRGQATYVYVRCVMTCGHEYSVNRNYFVASGQTKCPACARKDVGAKLRKDEHYDGEGNRIAPLGRQDIPELRQWRRDVLKRDQHTCQMCGDKAKRVHHKASFSRVPELKYSVTNGVALCKDCHKLFHMVYGFHRFTSEDWDDFFREYSVFA